MRKTFLFLPGRGVWLNLASVTWVGGNPGGPLEVFFDAAAKAPPLTFEGADAEALADALDQCLFEFEGIGR